MRRRQPKRYPPLWHTALVVLSLCALPSLASAAAAADPTPSRFVVGFHVIPRDLAAGDPFHGGIVLRVNLFVGFAVVVARDTGRFRSETATDPNVLYVEEDRYEQFVQFVPNDPLYPSQYGPNRIGAPVAWDRTFGDTDKNVCIVDTGVRYTHRDLTGPRWRGGYDAVAQDGDPWDEHGHGTHVAGIAAATIGDATGIAGVANVGLLGARVLDASGSGFHSWIAEGIQWCADNGGHVISMSLGGSGSSVVASAVQYAWSQGSLLVAASGNDGPCSECVLYPAAYPEVIAVGCTGAADTQCWYSNSGSALDLVAPGHDIFSTWYSSDSAYATLSGTSMAAPHASGAAALVWSSVPTVSAQGIRTVLEETARDLGASGWDPTYGRGLVDVGAALFRAVPPVAPPHEMFREDFDDGVADDWSMNSLWRVDDACATPPLLALVPGIPPGYGLRLRRPRPTQLGHGIIPGRSHRIVRGYRLVPAPMGHRADLRRPRHHEVRGRHRRPLRLGHASSWRQLRSHLL